MTTTSSVTERIYRDAAQVIPGGTSRLHYYYPPHPIFARSGSGCRLVDQEGVERIDFLNNMTALIHGHADPAITAAITEQLHRGTAWSEPGAEEVELARIIVDRVATVDQVRFLNSGSEAVMLAIKLAREFTGRDKVAKFEGGYHGYYDDVQVSVATPPSAWGPDDAPSSVANSGGLSSRVVPDVVVLPFNNRAAIESLLARHGPSIAALVVDPLSNRAGMPAVEPGFFEFLTAITRKYGIVLIFDEVIAFRLGWGGAQARFGGRPDLTVFGKIIGGGLPVGAVGGREEIMALLDPRTGKARVESGGTFSANPLTMVAGRTALDQLTPVRLAQLDTLGNRLRSEGTAIFRRRGQRGQIAGIGSLFRIVLTDERIVDYRSSVRQAAPAARMAAVHRGLMDHGVIVSRIGLGCLSTPMGDQEIDAFLAALDQSVTRLGPEGP